MEWRDETEMRPVWGWPRPHKPNTEARHKVYDLPMLRRIKAIRAEAGKLGELLPPNPCPYKICACCDSYRAFWDERLQTKTLSLF